MRKNSILISKINRLCDLLDEHTDVFFKERKWLTDESIEPRIEEHYEERYELETKIKKTCESASDEFRRVFPERVFTYEQSGISGVVE